MRYAFGMKFVHLFFNIPFLCLQKETLRRQLETNRGEIVSSYHELDCYQETPEADYNHFIDMVTQRRREMADRNSGLARGNPHASASQTSGRVMGGGQPIPGQQINSPKKTCSQRSEDLQCGSEAERTAERRISFEILNAEGDDGIDSFLEADSFPTASAKFNKSLHSEDEARNEMVTTFEEDFAADNELNQRMARLGEQRKVQKKSKNVAREALEYFEDRDGNSTPIAYKMKLHERDDDSPVRIPEPDFSQENESVHSIPSQAISTSISLAMSSADLDAWLGDDVSPNSHSTINEMAMKSASSDEEFGVRLPSPNPQAISVFPPSDKSTLKIGNNSLEKSPSPRKKKTMKAKVAVPAEPEDVLKKKGKKKKTAPTAKDSQKMLEEFLGPTEQAGQATEDYDPL